MFQKSVKEYEQTICNSNSKIADLNRKLSEFQITCSSNNFTLAANASATRITELSKKLREKCAEVEVLKTKYSKSVKLLKEYGEKLHQQEDVLANNGKTCKRTILLLTLSFI